MELTASDYHSMNKAMRNCSIVLLVILLSMACHSADSKSNAAQDGLYIVVTTEQSEHSMDSNSETTTLTVSGDELIYQQSHSGAHSRERGPVEKKFRLSAEEESPGQSLE